MFSIFSPLYQIARSGQTPLAPRESNRIYNLANRIYLMIFFPMLFPLYLTTVITILPFYMMFYAIHQFVWLTSIAVVGIALTISIVAIPATPAVGMVSTALLGLSFIGLIKQKERQIQQIEATLARLPNYFEMFD